MSTGQGILGYNMFAYCNSNPVMHVDYTGRRLMSALDRECAMMAGAFVISIPLIQIIADASVELAQDVGEAVSTAIETVNSKVEEKKSRTYSVYFLADDSETIQYVGRVTDIGYDARMRHHEQTRGLEPAYRISGLSYAEARGIEEIGMIECHTLNALNPVNNQIHGISWKNSNGAIYMKAACNYLFNHAEDWVINIFQ